MFDLILKNACLIDETHPVDLAVRDGKIAIRETGINIDAHRVLDLNGQLVVPGFVDSHVHLDIALMNSWDEPGRPEPYLSHYGLNDSLERRRKLFTPADIESRAGTALKLASRHGITALRAQCHVDLEVGLTHAQSLTKVKRANAGLVDVQIVGFPQQGLLSDKKSLDLFKEAFREGLLDVMGCASNLDRSVDFRDHITQALDLAVELGVDLDAHVDLGLHEDLHWEDLEVIHLANQTIERGYQGRVTAGHVSSLDSVSADGVKRSVERINAAGINVVSQPDLYRLGRDDQKHVRRGLTRVKELLEGGVNVTFASNNVRDALRPMGNFDLLEEALILSYGAHMDTIEELNTLINMCTENAARALRLQGYGLDVGCNADLVVLNAPSPSAAIIGQEEKSYVVKAGKVVAINQEISEQFLP